MNLSPTDTIALLRHGDAATWLDAAALPRLGLSAALLGWLTEPGSLTERLRARHGAVLVEVLAEGARAEPSAEASAPYWERCVQLVAAGRPRLTARSCIPAWAPDHPWQAVQQLGTRPLGEVLFALDGVARGPLQFAQLPVPAAAEAHLGAVVMARRCTYRRQGATLVLTEVFLDTD